MALVKVKHPIVDGNDQGFVLIDEANLTEDHEVLEREEPTSEEKIQKAFDLSIKAKELYEALTEEEMSLFHSKISEYQKAEADGSGAVSKAKGSKVAKTANEPPAPPPGGEIPPPNPAGGWQQS